MLARPILRNFLRPAWYTSQKVVLGRLGLRNYRSRELWLYFGVPRPTNREIEVKLPVEDIPVLVRKLKALKAANCGRVFERNTLYDTPRSHLRRSGRLLRVRTETPAPSIWSRPGQLQSMITSKAPPKSTEPKYKYKERLERETAISQSERWPRALASLGFRPSFVYEKFRTSFRLPGVHLDLDETPVGTFLELEGNGETIDRVAKALGYSARGYFCGTYWDVYAADCRRRGLPIKNMVFDRKKLLKSALFA
ncbi:MAG TPA: class IV adenylate cyclase [Candidatus Acidoferrales bacterium]|jgi:adenylate cyclase class 2|nr:class IV adenylate cyclase [Candidatus Acidoferrales bacterium]